MKDDTSTERFREAIRKDRCPVCFLASSSVLERLKSFLAEYVNDPQVRERISASGGFCRRHAWQAVSSGGNPVGVGLIHHALLTEGMERIGKEASGPSLFRRRKDSPECLLCTWERQVEDNLTKQWATCWAASTKLREDFDKNGILCIPHLEKAVRASRDRESRSRLLAAGRKALESLLKELEEYLGKQDHSRSREKDGDEWDSWIRAVRMRVGEKGTS